MARLLFSSAAVFLVMCTVLPTVVLGNKKTGIFKKFAEASRDLQATPATAAAAGEDGEGRFLSLFFDMFEEMTDKQWGTPSPTLDWDLMGLMSDVFVKDESHTRLLQEAWADPEVLRLLVDELPFFDVIKPLQVFKEKENLTASDGMEAVLILKDTMGKVLKSLESVRDPEQFAEKMYKAATRTDTPWKSLLARIEAGDESSHLEAQQFVLNEEVGDVIDLEAMGFGGQMPKLLGKALKFSMTEEKPLWDSLMVDPIAKRFVEDPMGAAKHAIEAAKDFAAQSGGSMNMY